MTRELAIKVIKRMIKTGIAYDDGYAYEPLTQDEEKACGMAIKALEQEQYYKDLAKSYEKTINKLTKAIAEQEPTVAENATTEQFGNSEELGTPKKNLVVEAQEPCEDCCNGNQIEKAKLCQRSYLAGMEHKQEPKTGHWISRWYKDKHFHVCSECQEEFSHDAETGIELADYPICPNCGCRMSEVSE